MFVQYGWLNVQVTWLSWSIFCTRRARIRKVLLYYILTCSVWIKHLVLILYHRQTLDSYHYFNSSQAQGETRKSVLSPWWPLYQSIVNPEPCMLCVASRLEHTMHHVHRVYPGPITNTIQYTSWAYIYFWSSHSYGRNHLQKPRALFRSVREATQIRNICKWNPH